MKKTISIMLALIVILCGSAQTSEAHNIRIGGSSVRISNRGNVVVRLGGVRVRGVRHVNVRYRR